MEVISGAIIGLIGTVLGVFLQKRLEIYMDKKKETKLFIADIKKVIEWGWDGKKLLRHLIALDYETTDNLNEGNEGTPNQWAPVFMNNPDCWKLLAIRDCELAGYWSFFPLKDVFFERIKTGQAFDSEITEDKIDAFTKAGKYNVYMVIFCIKEHYRQKGFKLLYDSLIDQINDLTRKGRRFNEICINAFTEEGKILGSNFGLKPFSTHKDYGILYCGKYEDIKRSKLGRGRLN